jgi:glutathione S-transferase
MKLYTFDPAPNPRRVQMFIAYKGLSIDTVQIDFMAMEQHSEAYLAINPQGTVPALVLDDGTLLADVTAIYCYLEALYPEKPLMGHNALEKAQITGWLHRLYISLFAPIADAYRNSHPAFTGRAVPGTLLLEQIPALAERGQQRVAAIWPEIDAHLENTNFIAGENFSAADVDLLAMIGFMRMAKVSLPGGLANVDGWKERAKAQLPQK